jgi:hypothetical protein
MRRLQAALLVICVTVLAIAGCGGPGPQPTPQPPPPPPPVNTAPQIRSIALSATRAEAGVPITLTATVEDAETPVANLTYAWTADTGTFSGTGPVVTWVAGEDAKTPADVVFNLTVTERFTSGSTTGENRTTGTQNVHLNNSPRELRELSLRFLADFANSRVSPEQCVAEFSDSCRGKRDELEDIQDNRHDFEIIDSTLRHSSLSIAPSGTTATVHTSCAFTSRVITDSPREESCRDGKCPKGSVGSVQGDCWTTNVYERGRWWICESHFASTGTLTNHGRAFLGIRGPR